MKGHRWFRPGRDEQGNDYLDVSLRGQQLLSAPLLNKGTVFTVEERDALGLRGLLPPRVSSFEEQIERIHENYNRFTDDLSRYMDLAALLDRNETLFYRFLGDRLEELLPIVYTPTVGRACQEFGHIFRRARGLYVTPQDRPRLDSMLADWPAQDVAVVVVTDGERVLGLGDLGANGMGIPIGKLSLYVAAAGVPPARTLPVCIDVGTNNEQLLGDRLYMGLRQKRVRGAEYDELLDAFLEAVTRRFPAALVQFEDFGAANAFRLLERNRGRYRCFNDDIQGTAAVATAGVLAALQRMGGSLEEQRFVFVGMGQASTGIASLLVSAMSAAGVPEADAIGRFWFVDIAGLVHEGQTGLAPHQKRFARTAAEADAVQARGGGTDLRGVVQAVSPTVLLGATAQAGIFDLPLLQAVAARVAHPMIFAMSNPSSRAECTPQQVYDWTAGQALVATGSPFPPVYWEGRARRIGQANNVFVFPGVGLGILASGAERVPDSLFLAAAQTLASMAPAEDALYPPLGQLRELSRTIAIAVAEEAVRCGVAPADGPPAAVKVDHSRWEPRYLPYRPA